MYQSGDVWAVVFKQYLTTSTLYLVKYNDFQRVPELNMERIYICRYLISPVAKTTDFLNSWIKTSETIF